MSLPYLQPYLGLSNGLNTLHAAGGGAGGIGGWVELGRVSLSGDSQTISGLADKRYLMLLTHSIPSGNCETAYQFNSDTGTNYAYRYSQNGSEASGGSINGIFVYGEATPTKPNFSVGYVANYSSKEKLYLSHTVASTTSATNSPIRFEMAHKWANTSNSISSVTTMDRASSGSFGSGETVVLGWDPADSHTNNFWEELGTADVSGGTIDISFTAKKYLWLQCYAVNSGSGGDHLNLRLGNTSLDSGANYSMRYSIDGAADGTLGPQNDINIFMSPTSNEKMFVNVFIINNASNEKLMIIHGVSDNASTGAANAPARFECVAKWANTSNQANILQLFNQGAGTLTGNSTARIWGAN